LTKLHILYENEAWLAPLVKALEDRKVPYLLHFMNGGGFDLTSEPPEGIFLNRMSPSSHTRGHQRGVRYVSELLNWLQFYGRRVINGSTAFDLELSKVKQDLALRRQGILTPHTIVAVGIDEIKSAGQEMPLPFITKHNQGGKGLGVRLFSDRHSFEEYLANGEFVDDPGGITLLQEYIEPHEPHITRVEIVAGEVVMAIHSSTEGGFELCPAVDCEDEELFCPASGVGKFRPAKIDVKDSLILQYIQMMEVNNIDVAGIEFIEDSQGNRYTYDINGTTNYNAEVEAELGIEGMGKIAELAERLLAAEYPKLIQSSTVTNGGQFTTAPAAEIRTLSPND